MNDYFQIFVLFKPFCELNMKYLNALYTIPGIGSETLRKLFGHFQAGKLIWEAKSAEMLSCGIPEGMVQKIVNARNDIDPDKEWEKLEKEKVSMVCFFEDSYPALLKEIHNPPFLIYYRGDLTCLNAPSIAIVGSRKFTPYGRQVAEKFSYDLAKAGLCVVSGLAIGIDAIAHRGALDGGGKTVAVLGSSIENRNIYPKINYDLAQEILSNGGLLISELPVPSTPNTGTFPARDRIMAGLTLGTLVIEAAEKSGSLITPTHGIEFNREVFAIPGSIYSPQSEGTNALIKKGAKLVANVNDILEELRIQTHDNQAEEKIPIKLSTEEEKIVHILSPQPTHIDIICKQTKLETSTLSGMLVMLELKGAIKNIGGQNYIKL